MKLRITCAALGALALAGLSAQAQTLGLGDIAVGFKTANSGTNLEVDAGNYTSTLSGFTTETLIGNYNTTLTSMSGAWATTTSGGNSLQWGAVGPLNDTTQNYASFVWNNTVAGTKGVQNSTGWNSTGTDVSSFLGTINTHLNSIQTAFNSSNANPFGDGKAVTMSTTTTGAWSQTAGGGGPSAPFFGGYTASVFAIGGKLDTGTNFSAVDLYLVQGTTATDLGTFALYNSTANGFNKGDLTFTASAIPEPSTYAAILGLATLGLIMARRRNRAVVA